MKIKCEYCDNKLYIKQKSSENTVFVSYAMFGKDDRNIKEETYVNITIVVAMHISKKLYMALRLILPSDIAISSKQITSTTRNPN